MKLTLVTLPSHYRASQFPRLLLHRSCYARSLKFQVFNVQVKLEVDVKAGNNPKVIAIDEAKSIGAYHVVLDK